MPGKTWPRWNWLDAVVLPLAGALMWAAFVGPPVNRLMRFMTADQTAGGAGGMAFALLLGGSSLIKYARRSRHGRRWVVLVGLLAVIAAEWWMAYRRLYAAWDVRWLWYLAADLSRLSGTPLVVLAIAAFLWWWSLGVDWTRHEDLAVGFILGTLVLGLHLALSVSASPRTVAELPGAIITFLGAAWVALSLAGVSEATRLATAASGTLRVNRYWLTAVLVVVAGIFGVGLLVAGVVTPQTVIGLLTMLRPVKNAVLWVVLYLFLGLAYLVFAVIEPLLALLRRVIGSGEPQTPVPLPSPEQLFKEPPSDLVGLPPAVVWTLRGLFLVGLVVLIGLLFAWALRRYFSTDEEGVRESRESIGSWNLIRAQLAHLLARRWPAKPPALFGPLVGASEDPQAVVRAAYRRVLALAIEHGRPRLPGQTPRGYLPALVTLWPDEATTLEMLTEAYTAVRYGDSPPPTEQVERLRQDVARIASPALRQSNGKGNA